MLPYIDRQVEASTGCGSVPTWLGRSCALENDGVII